MEASETIEAVGKNTTRTNEFRMQKLERRIDIVEKKNQLMSTAGTARIS